MKKLLSLFAIGLVFFLSAPSSSYAQLRKIPAEVTENFKQKYPGASDVEWRDILKGFSAEFKLDDIPYVAYFNNKREWESTEQVIEEDNLPGEVKEGFDKSKYADWTVGTIHKIELADNSIQYRVEAIKTDIRKRNLYFNSDGKLLKDKITL